jgi:hypothetical protein
LTTNLYIAQAVVASLNLDAANDGSYCKVPSQLEHHGRAPELRSTLPPLPAPVAAADGIADVGNSGAFAFVYYVDGKTGRYWCSNTVT